MSSPQFTIHHSPFTIALAAAVVAALVARADASAALRAVRSITTPDSTRLIVEFSAPVGYRFQREPGRPDLGVPPRLYVDFPDTRLSDVPIPGQLAEGPLRRLRATQSDATTTRLILDVPGLSDFGAFPLPDPFRLIIDVRGTPHVSAAHPLPPPATGARIVPGQRAAVARRPEPVRPGAATPDAESAIASVSPAEHGVPAARLPAARSQRPFKIVLDPGHGGKDPGAVSAGGVAEKDVVLLIALYLRDRLVAVPGLAAVLTRDSDVFLALEERTGRANAERADLFVSIHANASTDTDLSGAETYYLNNTDDHATLRLAAMENGLRGLIGHDGHDHDASLILSDLIQNYKIQESVALAENVQQALVSALAEHRTPVNNLGVKRGPFYVLVGAGMPCVLVEVSFLTHPEEGGRLGRREHQEAIAEGLLRGILRFVENTRVAENL